MQKSWRWTCWYLHEGDGDSAAKAVMTHNHWARLVRVTSAPMVTPDLGTRGEIRVVPTAPESRTPEKVRSSSPASPPTCLLFPSTLSDAKTEKKKWEITRTLLPCLLPPSSPPTTAACTYRTFGHWTLNSFLVCEFDECKHNRRGRKNKSVIARASLCQHLSRWAP